VAAPVLVDLAPGKALGKSDENVAVQKATAK
jgi:hypothetical protein